MWKKCMSYRVTNNFLTPSVLWRYKELRSYWFSTQVESHCGYSIGGLLWDNLKTLKHYQCWILWTLKVPECKKIIGHPVSLALVLGSLRIFLLLYILWNSFYNIKIIKLKDTIHSAEHWTTKCLTKDWDRSHCTREHSIKITYLII